LSVQCCDSFDPSAEGDAKRARTPAATTTRTRADGEEDEDAVETPLLPIFSAAHLDRLPLYNITHAIRLLIVQKCETTLSWDQLRSPQVSQFLVKPIQGSIRADHFNRATLCALLANCLQFQKEGQMNPGNVGVSRTRALVSELLAMRLLREFSTRELIDSLSYDFDPLQGMVDPATGAPGQTVRNARAQGRFARVSTIEIAIRAEAKRFLAHSLVVQHLEAIWAGNIVFHSEADNLHRKHRQSQEELRGRAAGYGTTATTSDLPADNVLSRKGHASKLPTKRSETPVSRRTVTLYNPKDASLFKLSRLRVPRYRQIFSTLSFAIMLGLFIAVLVDRSLNITPLEVVFWFWSIGYMLDEVVGFTEQGFGLYILSFWNAFDLGILFFFVVYYCLRLYGVVLAESGKHRIAGIAYDVLAANAILLFPRLFSVLDHYRYFSQLLIAFRMMMQDLMAILVLIVICCSGFFVALALSFAETRDASGVVYSLFQILMGFTPAVWDHWASYNVLGRAIMVIFLTICHFLIVTILITVMTNSFMAIVKNAEEEHQFLFAVNTISMVKSDALFSYIPPSNVFGWFLSPLRYIIPLRQFVKFNRTIIKVTHFPILFVIFSYERMIMSRTTYAPVDLIERQSSRKTPAALSGNKPSEPYTPAHRLREPSVISFRKDRALEEVFRRPFRGDTVRTTTREMEVEGRNSVTAVDRWMAEADHEGGASPPDEQPRSVLERLEHRRPKFKRANTADRLRGLAKQSRDFSTATRSIASDPDFMSAHKRPYRIVEESEDPEASVETLPMDTEADGDDEINDESDVGGPALGESAVSIANRTPHSESEAEYFQTPTGPNSPMMQLSHAAQARLRYSPEVTRGPQSSSPSKFKTVQRRHHDRQASSGTILFAPQVDYDSSVSNQQPQQGTGFKRASGATTPNPNFLAPGKPGTRTPIRKPTQQAKAQPIMPPRQKTAPNLASMGGMAFLDMPRPRQTSFNARALDLASEIGDNRPNIDAGGISGMPASFSEQMMRERDLRRMAEEERRRSEEEEKGMVNRIMLARMHTLEEGFREVLKEIKDMSQNANSSRRESEADSTGHVKHHKTGRPKIETRDQPAAAGWQTPKTPIGRIGGNEKSKKASPKKVVRQNSKKGKDSDRPGSSGLDVAVRTASSEGEAQQRLNQYARQQQLTGEAPSPESVKSIIELPKEEAAAEQSAGEGASNRPNTARPSTAIRTEDLIDLETPEKRQDNE
ncbi:Calcium channel YVC1, partial [Pseudocercospora fuligena]